MKLKENQLSGITKDWNNIAKESIEIKVINETIYAFGSELAVLRLLQKYRQVKKAKSGYSENIGTWYFRLEL